MRSGEDANAAWARHALSSVECTPSAYEQRTRKPRCCVATCKEKLVFSNTVVCKTCHARTCLRHRFSSDHACGKQRAPTPGAAGAAAMARLTQTRPAVQRREQCPSCSWSCEDVASLVAHCEQFHATSTQPAAAHPVMRAGGPGAREVCPICGARFNDVIALVEHHRGVHEPASGDASCHVC